MLRTLTDDERNARAHALADARVREAEERKIAEEDARRRQSREGMEQAEREAAEARKREEEERHRREEEAKRKAEQEAKKRFGEDAPASHDRRPRSVSRGPMVEAEDEEAPRARRVGPGAGAAARPVAAPSRRAPPRRSSARA